VQNWSQQTIKMPYRACSRSVANLRQKKIKIPVDSDEQKGEQQCCCWNRQSVDRE